MKKRIGILVIHNREGIVEEYVRYLLESLSIFLTSMIVVVNGYLRNDELGKIEGMADEIYIRENVGYDGGAYKEMLLKLFDDGRLLQYDELILCNDSFYGPLISWQFVFETMSKEDIDFWGLSKWVAGPSHMPGYPYLPEHVQAYFLVITSRMFLSECFIRFWESMEIPDSYDEAIRNYEIAFTTYFHGFGFRYKTWLDVSEGNCYLEPGHVVYCSHMADLIEKCKFPVIKKKAISLLEFEQYLRILAYLKKQGAYPYKYLEEGWKNYEKTGFPYDKLKEFFDNHEKIYIFGYGKWGKALKSYCQYKNWKIDGFVVTGGNIGKERLLVIDDLKLNNMVGIIVALGEKNRREVASKLRQLVSNEHLLMPKEQFSSEKE